MIEQSTMIHYIYLIQLWFNHEPMLKLFALIPPSRAEVARSFSLKKLVCTRL